jgi:hypothetical protein
VDERADGVHLSYCDMPQLEQGGRKKVPKVGKPEVRTEQRVVQEG